MTDREKKQIQQRKDALAQHIAGAAGELDPESLSRSYGLELAQVRHALKQRTS